MVKVKARQSFAGHVSMRIGEERLVELTETMQELIDCGHVEVIDYGEEQKNNASNDETNDKPEAGKAPKKTTNSKEEEKVKRKKATAEKTDETEQAHD